MSVPIHRRRAAPRLGRASHLAAVLGVALMLLLVVAAVAANVAPPSAGTGHAVGTPHLSKGHARPIDEIPTDDAAAGNRMASHVMGLGPSLQQPVGVMSSRLASSGSVRTHLGERWLIALLAALAAWHAGAAGDARRRRPIGDLRSPSALHLFGANLTRGPPTS